MNIILIGHGTVGKEVERVLHQHDISITSIIRSKDAIDVHTLNSDTYLFICVPSVGKGELVAHYYQDAFERGAKIITCEKAYLAYNWDVAKTHANQIEYSATVGGDSGILDAVALNKGSIIDIRAVVNGTLNYIGEKNAQGITSDEIYSEVTAKGFAEPGATNLEEVIQAELKDVLYKTIILANHSGLYDRVIGEKDVEVFQYGKYSEQDTQHSRCSVHLSKDVLRAGFIESGNIVFPTDANNALYINGAKIVEGPGAGGRITAERMYKDFLKFK
jgi:homoserine dehydrogenase